VVLSLGAALVGVGDPAGAADPRAEREKVRKRQAEVAAQLNVLEAESDEVEAAITALEREVAAQQAQVAAARQAVAVADEALAAARAAEAAMEAKRTKLEADLRSAAVSAFLRRDRSGIPRMEWNDDLSEGARQAKLTQMVARSGDDLADELRATEEDLGRARDDADRAAANAAAKRQEEEGQLASLASAKASQADLATKIDVRIERGLAEAAALKSLDEKLSAELARREAALARAGGGRSSGQTARHGTIPLRTVRGITVHADIAENLAALLEAASDDGITLGGGGYRDPADQQRLREAHCPDPENSPASSCSPPTARPGLSMHEQGLAVDFTWQGGVITSRSNPAFRWLAANAGRFGFHNLPSEPWHWSTNGN
jgi:LAS superfamily LD-carboxypeptidase LdcB